MIEDPGKPVSCSVHFDINFDTPLLCSLAVVGCSGQLSGAPWISIFPPGCNTDPEVRLFSILLVSEFFAKSSQFCESNQKAVFAS